MNTSNIHCWDCGRYPAPHESVDRYLRGSSIMLCTECSKKEHERELKAALRSIKQYKKTLQYHFDRYHKHEKALKHLNTNSF